MRRPCPPPKDYRKCYRWSGQVVTPVPYTRRYGSDVSTAFLNEVSLPGHRKRYKVVEGAVELRHTNRPDVEGRLLGGRKFPGITWNEILVMQPKKHRILALGLDDQLLLLNPDLSTRSSCC